MVDYWVSCATIGSGRTGVRLLSRVNGAIRFVSGEDGWPNPSLIYKRYALW
jgi:hypothetical protein